MSEWRDVSEPVHSVTLTLSTTCNHCAQPIPINSPLEVLHCANCSKDTPVAHLYEIIAFVSERAKARAEYQFAWFDDPSPECARCGKGVPIASYLSKEGATTSLPCEGCGAGTPTFPAPAWLKAHHPTALQVFASDAPVTHDLGGVDLAMNEAAIKPIAMACPSCGGGLSIGRETERTGACQFCKASVFIPDALWKQLHPVKTMLRWTLTYTGRLATPQLDAWLRLQATIAEATAEMHGAQKEADDLKAKYAARIAPLATPTPLASVPSASKSKAGLFIGLAVAVVIALAVVVGLHLSGGGAHNQAPDHQAKHGKH